MGELEPELEQTQKKAEQLEKALKGQLKVMKDGLPEHILKLLDKLDPVEQLEYITANHAELATKPSGGIDPTPKPAAGTTKVSADKLIESKQRSRAYSTL